MPPKGSKRELPHLLHMLPKAPVLLPHQRRIARLMALGWNNAEVGKTLKRNSISWTITEIYKRLGVHNRIEFFRLVSEHPEILSERTEPKVPVPNPQFSHRRGVGKKELSIRRKQGYLAKRAAATAEVRLFIRALCKRLMSIAIRRINRHYPARKKAKLANSHIPSNALSTKVTQGSPVTPTEST